MLSCSAAIVQAELLVEGHPSNAAIARQAQPQHQQQQQGANGRPPPIDRRPKKIGWINSRPLDDDSGADFAAGSNAETAAGEAYTTGKAADQLIQGF